MVSSVLVACACVLVYRLFTLQIVKGEQYVDSFQLIIMKEKDVPASRGLIYDRNGNILAYNELANSVTIEDVYKTGSGRNAAINATINKVLDILEKNGDDVDESFSITLTDNGEYAFTVEGNQLLRFLADVYGRQSSNLLKYEEKNKSAKAVVEDLCTNFGIGGYTDPDDRSSFVPGLDYDRKRLLQVLTVRYNMNANSYQKYIDTTIASNVSIRTVADVMENSDTLDGVSIAESTARVYVDPVYFSHIMGYTGKISETELSSMQAEGRNYSRNDIVGKSGIEQTMEEVLQGKKGRETLYVDKTGQVLEKASFIEPVAGNDVYLTIDKDLQEACYNILEESLAGILVSKIKNLKSYQNADGTRTKEIIIPVQDVYYALFDNHVIDITHLSSDEAGETESQVQELYLEKQSQVRDSLLHEMETRTPYRLLSKEYQVYQSYAVAMLYQKGYIDTEKVVKDDETYIKWTQDETISMAEYIQYCISQNWVDVSKLSLDSQYVDSEKIMREFTSIMIDELFSDNEFCKRMFKYLIYDEALSGRSVCNLLLEQGAVTLSKEEEKIWSVQGESAYTFIINRISELDITPAQLALDPCTASMVVTDVRSGDVLALVSYPGYDNNMLANGVNARYYNKLRNDLSNPLLNYATMQRTAPGSTFKMVTATAGLMENVIDTEQRIVCRGIYDNDNVNPAPRCWIYPGAHGSLNVTGGIRNSCNCFFYDLGYRLGIGSDNVYHTDLGLDRLKKYADMYGLTDKSGVEISEYDPIVSNMDPVRSAIGQAKNSYTTVGLARYVTTVANSGTCYNLTLIDKTTDPDGNLLDDNSATVRNVIEMDTSWWNAIHRGMREVVEDKSYYDDLGVTVAGKTGTAQESTSRPNHSLFVCYAPYETPEIAIATRVAYGYTSGYAAEITRDALAYYFNTADREEIVSGAAHRLEGGAVNAD